MPSHASKDAPGPAIAFHAVRPKGRERVIVATNHSEGRALALYRKRWAIECFFADAKTRGLNPADTRLTCPRKLALLTAILVIAIAWPSAAATKILGIRPLLRKKHGYPVELDRAVPSDQTRQRARGQGYGRLFRGLSESGGV